MQTSGQFGVPPPEVPPHYNPVSNTMNNNSSNTSTRSTSTPGSNQTLGHMLFNFSTPLDQHAPLSSPAPPSSHGQPAALLPSVLLGKAGTHDGSGGTAAAELYQEANPPHQQQQQQQIPRFSHFLQSAAAAPEHFQAADNARQEHKVQEKQGSMGSTGQAQGAHIGNVAQEGGGMECNDGKGNAENQQMGADPISLGDIDQAEEGAGAGNRWPRQETLALLKIRADMDASFRDTSVKRPLWDEVSRKMGVLGYERNAKKCKEKFENVNKYYKRTKGGKVGRQDGKNYRFFTQLEALSTNSNNNNSHTPLNNISNSLNNNPPNSLSSLTSATMLISNSISSTIDTISKFKASASEPPLLLGTGASGLPCCLDPNPRTSDPLPLPLPFPFPFPISASAPPPSLLLDPSFRPPLFAAHASAAPLHLSSPSSAGDDDNDDDDDDNDDDDDDGAGDDDADDDYDYDPPRPASDLPLDPSHPESKKRKRKASSNSMMAFFEGLLKKVIDKQEQMQQKFLQALERRETDRMIREEAWRRQEMARLSKEHDLRAQERTSAAARDAALISFLQKFTGQTVDLPPMSTSVPIAAQPVQCAPPLHQESMTPQPYEDQDPLDPNSKRWLKPEVLALIELHSSLQAKFTEAGPKGHLWEEIANGMAKLGYSSRTAKRCKEKWENINKYFKRAKESNKKRPENAKTCPYFHELDALYRKGTLGSSHVNQVAYKPSIEHAQPQIDDESGMHQPSSTSINTGEGTDGMDLDCVRNLQAQPAIISGAPSDQGDAATNVSVVGAGDATRPDNVSSVARSGFRAELGLNSPQEFGKVNAGGEQESKPSVLAPLPNSSSFMSSMMQKINSSSAAASNITTNRDQ